MTKNESFEILAIANSEFHGSEISLCQNVSSEIPFVRRQRIPLWLHTHTYIPDRLHILRLTIHYWLDGCISIVWFNIALRLYILFCSKS